jgi:hypothetical protein
MALDLLTFLNDRRYATGGKKRAVILNIIRDSLNQVCAAVPLLAENAAGRYARLDWAGRNSVVPPAVTDTTLIVVATDFPPEGDDCDAR